MNENGKSNELILVADDDEHIVELVAMYLRREGYRVEAAYDGDETLRKVNELHPSLLVLDIMMPGPDGLQICRSLRRRSNVPILLVTARTSDIDKIAGLRFGADDYVTKPFNPEELIARVEAVLRPLADQHQRRAEGRPHHDRRAGDRHLEPDRGSGQQVGLAHASRVRPAGYVRPLSKRRARPRAPARSRLGHLVLCPAHCRRARRASARKAEGKQAAYRDRMG